MAVASGEARGGSRPPSQKITIEEYKKPKYVFEHLGTFR